MSRHSLTGFWRNAFAASLPIVLFAIVSLASANSIRADTITFNSLEQSGGSLVHTGDPYTEAGYRIINGGELYFYQQSHIQYAGSAGLHERISTV